MQLCSQVLGAAKWADRTAGRETVVGVLAANAMSEIPKAQISRPIREATAIDWSAADKASEVQAQTGTLKGKRNAAMVAIMSDAMLRSIEVSALEIRDLSSEPDGSGRLDVRGSTTNQTGMSTMLYIGPQTMERIDEWLQAAEIQTGKC